MSLLTQASLVITPSAYKEGKLYSVIPSDGSGDLSVTRATTATRVNSQGLVELVPYNLLRYSEDFTNGVWGLYSSGTGVNPIVTANTTTSPNGTNTADTIVFNAGAGTTAADQSQIYQTFSITNGNVYTFSFYAKGSVGGEQLMMRHAAGSSYTKITLTNDWARYEVTETATYTGTGFLELLIRRGLNEPINASCTFYAWGAQLVEGSVAKDYQKTETRLNIPRLDYSNGTCPSILVEPQRTNLNLYSEDLSDAWYTKAQYGTGTISVTANYGLAPDGTMTADRVQMTKGNFASEIHQRPLTTIGQTYTLSFWAKSLSGTPTLYTAFNNGYENSVTFTSEWVRYQYTYTAANAATGFNLITWTNLSGTSASADLLVWGAQLEAGSYPTSYIPTTSASVTRNADAIYKTGISSLIGQTEGTFFCELDRIDGAENMGIWMRTGGTPYNEIITFIVSQFGVCSVYVRSSSSDQFVASSSALSLGKHKFALAYKANDFAFYIDGVQIATSTSGTPPTCDQIYLGGYPDGGARVSKNVATALWKTRLTNTQLAQLTTI